MPRRRRWRSSRAGWWPSRWRWSSRRAMPDEVAELAGLPELVVAGLPDDDARALLGSALPGSVDERVLDRIVAETRGNPLALLELPRGLTPAELAGGFGLPGAAALPQQIEESFRRQLAPLPTRHAAAAAGRGRRAAGRPRAGVARGRAARHRVRRGGARGGGRAARDRRPRAVPASAGALGDLPGGLPGGAAQRAPGAGGGHRSRGRSRSPRLARAPRPHPGPTRTSPRSSSARPGAHRRAAGWPRPPRSWNGPPS